MPGRPPAEKSGENAPQTGRGYPLDTTDSRAFPAVEPTVEAMYTTWSAVWYGFLLSA